MVWYWVIVLIYEIIMVSCIPYNLVSFKLKGLSTPYLGKTF